MSTGKLINEIVKDLQENAMPFSLYAYEPKLTHQILRKHLDKLNNIILNDQRKILRELLQNLEMNDELATISTHEKIIQRLFICLCNNK